MWRWARRWADWVRNDVLPLARTRRGGHAVHIRYEAGGRQHAELPVPWAADAVTVEVVLRLPPAARRKSDFALRFPLSGPIPADSIRPDTDDRFRVAFRFTVPRVTATGEVLWKCRPVAPVCVPVLTADAYLASVTLVNPTVAVRLGGQVTPARAFVADGCKGLFASAVVRSAHRLAPVADLGLSVEFRSERRGRSFVVPVPLPTEQRAATETLVSVACPRRPRRPGWWSVTWRLGDRVLATDRVEAIASSRFEDSVRLLDSRFAAADRVGPARMLRLPPAPGAFDRVGPCFLVSGSETGAAGLCRLGVFAVSPGNPHPKQLLEQAVLVTDAPTVFAPGLVDAADLVRVSGFELRLNGRVLGIAALSPVPPATLTAEGGFKPPRDFAWTPAAEDELQERLGRLGGG